MNFLYFACLDCKTYIDAGYRWAFWELENTGVVRRGQEVSVEAVLAADGYWNPPKGDASRWLYEVVFPPLTGFLKDHKRHRIIFGELDDFAPLADDFDWMQIGYLLLETPRYFVEVLGFKWWDQVCTYLEQRKPHVPWWEMSWGDDPPREKAKKKFEQLLRDQGGANATEA